MEYFICKGLCIYYVRVDFASLRWRLASVASPGPGASRLGGAGGKIAEMRPGPGQKYGRSQAGCGITRVTGNWHYSAKYEYIRASFSVSLAT